jgi:hypothetical protein
LGGWKNSSCDFLEVEKCRGVARVCRRTGVVRSPRRAVDADVTPLQAALLILADSVEVSSVLEEFIAVGTSKL